MEGCSVQDPGECQHMVCDGAGDNSESHSLAQKAHCASEPVPCSFVLP